MRKDLEELSDKFWQMDFLIRALKEILSSDNWDMTDSDINTICNMLLKISQSLNDDIKLLKKQFVK